MGKPTSQQVRDARKDAGITQAQAAKLISCTTRAYQRYESGDRAMSAGAWELMQIKLSQLRRE